jgi:hypothetical protein
MDSITDRTAPGRRKPSIGLHDLSPSPLLLVLEEGDKLRPAGIGDGFGQSMIGQHALDMQRLQRDGAVGIDQFPANLMMKISSLIGDPFMLDRHPVPGFVSVTAAFLLATQAPLANPQQPFLLSQMARIVYLLARRQGQKMGQSQVDANLTIATARSWSRRMASIEPSMAASVSTAKFWRSFR